TCALMTSGVMQCWGTNSLGELGDGTTTARNTPAPVIGLSGAVVFIATGQAHSCAVTSGGLQCWGLDQFGQLADGSTTNSSTPVAVSGLSTSVSAVAAGGEHTCALTTSGGLQCWGWDYYTQLADGAIWYSPTPITVPEPDRIWMLLAGIACLKYLQR